MHRVFKELFTSAEVDDLINTFNGSSKGWYRLGAINSDGPSVDYDSSRKAVAQAMHPDKVPVHLKDKVLKAVQQTDKTRSFDFIEQWAINKYKDSEKGHFYWHKDRLDFFIYHGGNVNKQTAEQIFMNNMRPQREMSVSVALNDRSDYNGGQFVIDVGDGKKTPLDLYKGDAVVFDSDTMHGVEDVTQGTRYALVIWLVDKEKSLQWKQLCLEQGIETT